MAGQPHEHLDPPSTYFRLMLFLRDDAVILHRKCEQISLSLESVKTSRKGLDKQRFLFGKDGAKVEHQPVVCDSGDHGDAGSSAPQALFEYRCGVARTGDSNDFCGKRL